MNNNTIIVLVLVALAIIGIVMYQSSVQAQRDREMQLQLAAMQNTGESGGINWLEQIGNLGGIFSQIGGLFGGGSNNSTDDAVDTTGDIGGNMARMMTNDMDAGAVTPAQMAQAKVNMSSDIIQGMSFN